MAWSVFDPVDMVFNGKMHRMLEIEADTTDELDALLEKSMAKGWIEYCRGHRPESGKPVLLCLKPV
jgi:hypothetical protein